MIILILGTSFMNAKTFYCAVLELCRNKVCIQSGANNIIMIDCRGNSFLNLHFFRITNNCAAPPSPSPPTTITSTTVAPPQTTTQMTTTTAAPPTITTVMTTSAATTTTTTTVVTTQNSNCQAVTGQCGPSTTCASVGFSGYCCSQYGVSPFTC
jgi:hypothetical protein